MADNSKTNAPSMKLPSAYEPAQYEADIYALWEHSRAFEPKHRGNEERFSIVAPPPNANANLHIGYGLTMAVEDVIVRYQRLLGKATLFVPGADHAGFETWVVYEKKLAEQGKSRFDFSREELYRQVWDFVEMNKHNFQSQIRALGASADWSRFTYTLDQKVVNQAYATFKKMWDEGLIYRGERIVNFCTFHGTSFSDIEVVHEEEKSKLWYIAYPLKDGSGEAVIATSRPETKLGQSALMVNPKDERYQHLIGKEVLQPLVPDKPIPIIADDYVDMDFGTGIVTVTPAHDPHDFEVSKRHHLESIELITPEGKMSENVPEPFRGLTVLEAREAVAKALEEAGLLRKVKDYVHSVGKCYKCGTLIEPLLREQWFVNMEPLAKRAIAALEDKKIAFYPDAKRTQLIRYLEGLHDWNISRQIAWGIPIPAFQNTAEPKDWIFDTRVEQEEIEVDGKKYRRDPDVFDTWFSSCQWPYVTLNFPGGEEYKRYYPLNLMETGGEILHQWVARMIMLGLYVTGDVPFRQVYIHGYVMAPDGRKMSKSLGNTVDLMEVIAKYGSDALRMGILAGRVAGVNRPYDPRRVEEARNFTNKLWNVARFIEDRVVGQHALRNQSEAKSSVDHWILNKLSNCAAQMSKHLDNYRLSEAYETLYHFVWDDLADWYVEASKATPNPALMAYVLEATLKMAHPFAPFVTETIWQTLAWEDGTLLAVQHWPEPLPADTAKAEDFDRIIDLVSDIRRVTTALGLNRPKLTYKDSEAVAANTDSISALGRLGGIEHVQEGQGLKLTHSRVEAWLAVSPAEAQNYLDKLKAQQEQLQNSVKRLEGRLLDGDYTAKAPQQIVDQTRQELEREKGRLEEVSRELTALS